MPERPRRGWPGFGNVRVVTADALALPMPRRPFRVVANPPFGSTKAILRRLLGDPRVPLERADLVLQEQAARRYAARRPADPEMIAWGAAYELGTGRRLGPACFRPRPRVGAAVLVARRRRPPLVPGGGSRGSRPWSGTPSATPACPCAAAWSRPSPTASCAGSPASLASAWTPARPTWTRSSGPARTPSLPGRPIWEDGPRARRMGGTRLPTAAEGSMGTLTLSTRITLLRIALIPVLLWLLVAEGRIERAAVLAAIVFLVASFTDFVDGYLARRWQQTTMLGNFLDTTADKLLVVGALLGLMAVDRVNVWVAFVVIAREVAVLGLRAIAAASNVVISASIWGKVKFNVQVVGITLAILRPDIKLGSLWLDEWAMLAVAVVSAASAVDYFARFGDLIRAGK